jgi:S1-C subfamily serine protease
VRAADEDAASIDALYTALDRAGPDGSVPLTVVRGVDEHALTVQLSADSDNER